MKLVFWLYAFIAPIRQLLEILSKCPRKRNQGPAIEMWSVVHFPKALISNFAPVRFSPFHGAKGVNSSKRSELSLTSTETPEPSVKGAKYPLSFTSKPLGGSSTPVGASRRTSSPFSLISVSVIGLKSSLPEMAIAATISGEATKAYVLGFPSALFEKFLLKECMMVFFSCLSASFLAHCPIQGPQALVNMVASKSSKIFSKPSLSAVKRTCSEPGLIPNVAFVTNFLSTACLAIEAARDKSS